MDKSQNWPPPILHKVLGDDDTASGVQEALAELKEISADVASPPLTYAGQTLKIQNQQEERHLTPRSVLVQTDGTCCKLLNDVTFNKDVAVRIFETDATMKYVPADCTRKRTTNIKNLKSSLHRMRTILRKMLQTL